MMSENDRNLFEDAGLELSQLEKNLIGLADSDKSRRMSKARVKSTLYGSKLIKNALDEHAKALIKSAEASVKHERGLKRATWALVAATVALVIVGILPIILK